MATVVTILRLLSLGAKKAKAGDITHETSIPEPKQNMSEGAAFVFAIKPMF